MNLNFTAEMEDKCNQFKASQEEQQQQQQA